MENKGFPCEDASEIDFAVGATRLRGGAYYNVFQFLLGDPCETSSD